jgi:hypothetical protein
MGIPSLLRYDGPDEPCAPPDCASMIAGRHAPHVATKHKTIRFISVVCQSHGTS